MKEDQLTPWFPAEVKPVHVGWYEKDFGPQVKFPHNTQFWNGRRWFYGGLDRFKANDPSPIDSVIAPRPWRGLRSKT